MYAMQPDPKQVPERRAGESGSPLDALSELIVAVANADDGLAFAWSQTDPEQPAQNLKEICEGTSRELAAALEVARGRRNRIVFGQPSPESGSGEEGDWPEIVSEAETALAAFDSHGDYEAPIESLRRITQKLFAPTQPLQGSEVEREAKKRWPEGYAPFSPLSQGEIGEAAEAAIADCLNECYVQPKDSASVWGEAAFLLQAQLQRAEVERDEAREQTEAMAWAAGWETDGCPPFEFETVRKQIIESGHEDSRDYADALVRATQAEARIRRLERSIGEVEEERDAIKMDPEAERILAAKDRKILELESVIRSAEARIQEAVEEFERRATGYFAHGNSKQGCCYENAAAFLRSQSSSEVGEEGVSTAESWSRLRLRRMHSTEVEAVQYVGGFPLCLLRDGEKIRAGDNGLNGDCVVMQPGGNEAYLHLGDWLIRWDDGRLAACPPDNVGELFEPPQPREESAPQPVKTHWLATRGDESWLLAIVPDAEGSRSTIAVEGRYANEPGTDAIFHAWPSPKQAREIADALRVRADEVDSASPSTPRDEESK